MKNSISSLFILVFFLLSIISCQNESSNLDETANGVVPNEVVKLIRALSFNPVNVYSEYQTNLEGTKELKYIIENDLAFTKDELEQMYHLNKENLECNDCQYRTRSKVTLSRPIKILGYINLSPKMKQGLRNAVRNYNRLGLTISFKLTFGTRTRGKDIIVSKRNVSGSGGGGIAQFPSGGRPGKYIRINSSMDNSGHNNAAVTRVIAHEIGHAIGMRHTDYKSRKSCGGKLIDEGGAGHGAVHIPGTPGGSRDNFSLFNACLPARGSGHFSHYDRIALKYVY